MRIKSVICSVGRSGYMHRDLMAMNDRTRASDDRLTSSITAVQESLKQLAQQVEKSAAQPQQLSAGSRVASG